MYVATNWVTVDAGNALLLFGTKHVSETMLLYLIIIIKSEVWTITHCLGLGHETMVCAVCRSVFFWLIVKWTLERNLSEIWIKVKIILSRIWIWNYCFQIVGHFAHVSMF